MTRARRRAVPCYALLLSLLITAPLLAPGYLLLRDAVSTPRSWLSDTALGLSESAARAVPQDFAVALGSAVLSLPAATDTLVGKATTDTFTNKTFNTAGTGNTFQINGTGITAVSGNTATVATTSGTMTNGNCVSIDASGNLVAAGAACGSSSGANPTASVGLSAVNGAAGTFMRSDAAPPLDQSISPTWTGAHRFNSNGVGLNTAAGATAGTITSTLAANNVTGITVKRNTDTSPTGNFMQFQNAAGTAVWTTDITGTVTAGTWQGGVISSTYGGTGVNNGGRTLTVNTNSGTLAYTAASKTLSVSNSITLAGTDSTTMTFPSSSATITQTIASGAKALATSAISSGACSSAQTDTATGTATTDAIIATFNGDPTAVTGYIPSTNGMLTIIAYPTSNTVNFKVCNNTNASVTPGAVTINWRVVR